MVNELYIIEAKLAKFDHNKTISFNLIDIFVVALVIVMLFILDGKC